MTASMKKEQNLLEGPLFSRMMQFILPLMMMNLLQTFYNAADMIVVGMSGVEGALGAIGTTGAMLNFFLNMISGFALGGNVLVARHIGAGNERMTRLTVHTAILSCAIFGVLDGIVGYFGCRPILAMLGDEGHVLDMAAKYSRIYFLAVPFLTLSNGYMAVFRAKGDTRTPLLIMSGCGLANVILNLIFVLEFGMDVDGVAYATLISNVLSAVLLMVFLMKDDGWCHFSFRELKLDMKTMKDLLSVGIPAAVQGCLFSISNMLIQSSIISINNELYPGGSAVIDGNAAAGSLEGFIYSAANSGYQAAVTFTSQHLGAGKIERLRKVRRCSLICTFIINFTLSMLVYIFRRPLTGLYVSSEESLSIAFLRQNIFMFTYFICSCMDTCSGILRGLGRSLQSTIISLFGCCVFRVFWITVVFRMFRSLALVYWSYPISWAMTFAVSFAVGEKVIRKYLSKAQTNKAAVT